MKRFNLRAVTGAAVLVTALSACSYAAPDAAFVGVSYTGGTFESKSFDKCVDSGVRTPTNWGGDTYYYPVGTRTRYA